MESEQKRTLSVAKKQFESPDAKRGFETKLIFYRRQVDGDLWSIAIQAYWTWIGVPQASIRWLKGCL
jgi:hypothetical protein